ncbi:MAG: hypothetical protein OXP66_09475 [Candidatus Tectomicrobia bacterium]|nr:hypothetical protein [Candidatus Tectomicrobia bacterium]
MGEGKRGTLSEIGKAKGCGLVFMAQAPGSCAAVSLSGGGDLAYRPMILVSGVFVRCLSLPAIRRNTGLHMESGAVAMHRLCGGRHGRG